MDLPERVDVLIAGGALMGSSVAFHLLREDPSLTVALIDPDPSFENTGTARTNSCIRQQFGTEINVRISQHGVQFIREFADELADGDVPNIHFDPFGYLYLAADPTFADVLRSAAAFQTALGAGTRIMGQGALREAFPFIAFDDILLGSHGSRDEGYFDGGTMFYQLRRAALRRGAIAVGAAVTRLEVAGGKVRSATLSDGRSVACGAFVNCAGTRGASIAAMAGLSIPVEPRRRYSFVFSCPENLGAPLPLTIDPSGVHVRQDGANFLAGCPPDDDAPPDPEDMTMEHEIWEEKVWPAVAARVPAFERARVVNAWIGHYDFNTLDQNAILGPAEAVPNFYFCNGFSGHGFQQSPAVGRGIAEHVLHGEYRTLDLSPLGHSRVLRSEPLLERAII